MTRAEAVALLTAALAMITGGVVWLFHAWGLLAVGVLLGAVVLFMVDIRDPEVKE